eukprot:jgi/Chlat1/2739/Chrsp187S02932
MAAAALVASGSGLGLGLWLVDRPLNCRRILMRAGRLGVWGSDQLPVSWNGWTTASSRTSIGATRPQCGKRRERTQTGDSSSHVCASSSGRSSRPDVDTEELPLFPLGLVLFPGAVLPLQIFEFRYRIMFNTLLNSDQRFGIIYAGDQGTAAAIGCCAEVFKHERFRDDRLLVVCRGLQRFRVVDVVRTKPYLVGRVQWIEDRVSSEPEALPPLVSEVESLMRDVIRLSNKISGKPPNKVPEELSRTNFPAPFSFFVASTFEAAPLEQQVLLELQDTAERLRRERDTLRRALNYLSAATAVKDVFASSEDK